jgi:nicotinamidase-related amidase
MPTLSKSPEAAWAEQVEQIDLKELVAEGAHLVHVDDTNTFFPNDPGIAGTGELPVAGGDRIIEPINSVTPYFGDHQIGLYERHPQTGTAYFASTYRALGINKVAFDPTQPVERFTLTLEEFRQYRRRGIVFPFEADRFEAFLEQAGGTITLWPDHSRQRTPGAQIHPGIIHPPQRTFIKGASPEVHHFGSRDTFLEDAGDIPHMLRERIKTAFGVGLAEDYCLGTELLAIADSGIRPLYFLDGTAAIDAPIGDGETTLTQMRQRLYDAGVIGITSAQFIEQMESKS